ncbi:RluA family pseudouridine synthase [Paracoccus suum]|uniref:Pseudouridine synthase n=1 Tax=Paracoccus suum TaxID=2259340 RepID=A0A344PKA9_9RHOB|nr:RluA family pseudouridine synthase [Paracoccus suum]AXC49814.1 RluA family pseudouridine synthase [Paracoccus suum]
MAHLIVTVPTDLPPERLDKTLASLAPEGEGLSRTRIARLMAEGAITGPAGIVRDGKGTAQPGDYHVALPPPAPVDTVAEDIQLAIAYEDEALIVIDKPAGMVVHPAPGSPAGTLVNALLAHCEGELSGVGGVARPGIVHRIDKDTSGLLVVAKTDHAHQTLAAQFAAHTAERRYLALANGVIDPADARLRGLKGTSFEPGGVLKVANHLGRHPGDRQRQAVVARGRHAVTRARMIESFGTPPAAMLVECQLETGRTHQIRVHLAYCGLSLIGDPVYGGARRASTRALGPAAELAAAFPRQALHAAHLGFVHPLSSETLRFDSPLPSDMAGLLAALQRADA